MLKKASLPPMPLTPTQLLREAPSPFAVFQGLVLALEVLRGPVGFSPLMTLEPEHRKRGRSHLIEE